MVHAGLLGKLPLRHLLGFELSSKPVVERSAVLSGHMCLNAPLVYPFEGALAQLSAGCRHGCITHSYRAGAPRRLAQRRVWCGLDWCGPGAGEYLAKLLVRPGREYGSAPGWCRVHPAGSGRCQAGAVSEVIGVGCGIRPMPRGIGETTYVTAPKTMIERTLMTQSRMVIAVASASGIP